MIDLSKTVVVCNEFRHPIRRSAAAWLAEHVDEDRVNRIDWDWLDIPTYRNRVVRDIVLPAADACDWALFVDNDVTITHPGMERFLALEADVASARCRMRRDLIWCRPDAFHCTLWFARIEVFQRIDPPWFRFVYSDDGCEMLGCECRYFRDKVQAAGYHVAHGGWCGHACEAKWCG
jgi:hypothetical protein